MRWKQEISDWVQRGVLPDGSDGQAAQFVAILQNDFAAVLSYGYTDRVGEWAEDVLLLVPRAARGSANAIDAWQSLGGVEGLIRDRRQLRHTPAD